jgi:hypothetical protein
VEAASAAEARIEASFDCWRRGREVRASREVPEVSSSSLSRLGFRRSGGSQSMYWVVGVMTRTIRRLLREDGRCGVVVYAGYCNTPSCCTVLPAPRP